MQVDFNLQTLSPVQLGSPCKAESGSKQPSMGWLIFKLKCVQVGMRAAVLIFWFLNSVSVCVLQPLSFINVMVSICYDMLKCRESLPAPAQGQTIFDPPRLSRMFPHHRASEPTSAIPSFCSVPFTTSSSSSVTTSCLLKASKAFM